MKRQDIFIILVGAATLLCGCWSAGSSVLGVRAGRHPHGVRVVIDVEREGRLPSLPSLEKQEGSQLFIILKARKHASFKIKNPTDLKIFSEEKAEGDLVIGLQAKSPLKKESAFFIGKDTVHPARYVLDFSEKASSSAPEGRALETRKKKIIIDAGHGGKDPGTRAGSSPSDVCEKDITLSIAHLLKRKLEETQRYQCLLTREQDSSMTLPQRLKLVGHSRGDLFISVHVDSHPQKETRGLSIYTLSAVASDREAARLAQKENKADTVLGTTFQSELPEIASILIDLTKRETMNFSSLAAKSLIEALRREIFLLRKPHRFADFFVLRSPHIPSLLIELGFLSNQKEKELLSDPEYQEKLCDGLVRGIHQFFGKVVPKEHE